MIVGIQLKKMKYRILKDATGIIVLVKQGTCGTVANWQWHVRK